MSQSTLTIAENGTKIWKNIFGQKHRVDGPAVERADGSKFWYQNGKFHRIDGPAVLDSGGTKHWYENGVRHRVDGPAVEWESVSLGVGWYHNNCYLGQDIGGFWKLWDRLNDEERQNVNLHMWLRKLTNV